MLNTVSVWNGLLDFAHISFVHKNGLSDRHSNIRK